jgi:protein tyrosine phosphatase (PTP) superfamily phosphohydrolase (DUF442 family)
MKTLVRFVLLQLVTGSLAVGAFADGLTDIVNFRQYSPVFASSGQPTEDQLELLRADGYTRVIYIAFSSGGKAIANEDGLVKELGMEYIHIPVIWDKPATSDFYAFADVMRRYPDKKTLLHCQVNYRASAFSFLYRVLYQDVPVEQAKADMNTVWQPDETWRDLIFSILEENGKSAACDTCNWEPNDQ